jgi:chemotaxis receptor (MCP) glutamine deamidase CheD
VIPIQASFALPLGSSVKKCQNVPVEEVRRLVHYSDALAVGSAHSGQREDPDKYALKVLQNIIQEMWHKADTHKRLAVLQ